VRSVALLFVSGEYPPDVGGVGDYTARLRDALARQGWPSRVLSRARVRRWDARSLVWLLRAAPSQGIVHIQYQAGAYDLLGDVCLMPTLLRRLRPGVRVVTTFHDVRLPYLFPKAGALRQMCVSYMARRSHAVIAADERDLVMLGGPSPRHHRVPIGANLACEPGSGYHRAALRARLGLDPDALVVVYFGLLNASKGLDLLLDAFAIIQTSMPTARLLLLGGEVGASDPTDRQTAARVRHRLNAFGQRVVRTGWLPPPELSAHLLAADVALLPYADGASPRRGSLLACAEHGLPIVSTQPASGALSQAIQAVPAEPARLAAAVLQIAQSETLKESLQHTSRLLADSVNWSSIASAHIKIYTELIGQCSR
jgi:glycosyltransferase involved in cell wall biosynthesis